MQKKLSGTTITIPVPDHKEVRIGTLLSIIRQSGLSRNTLRISLLRESEIHLPQAAQRLLSPQFYFSGE